MINRISWNNPAAMAAFRTRAHQNFNILILTSTTTNEAGLYGSFGHIIFNS